MEVRLTCPTCRQPFWTKAKKNKTTGHVEPRHAQCQRCRNFTTRIAHAQRYQQRVAEIPKDAERYLRLGELRQAEKLRRRHEQQKKQESETTTREPLSLEQKVNDDVQKLAEAIEKQKPKGEQP